MLQQYNENQSNFMKTKKTRYSKTKKQTRLLNQTVHTTKQQISVFLFCFLPQTDFCYFGAKKKE